MAVDPTNDKILKLSMPGSRAVVARLIETKQEGATGLKAEALTGWPEETAVPFVMYEVDQITGKPVPGTDTDWVGEKNNNTIQNMILTRGTDRTYPVSSTRIMLTNTAEYHNRLATALLKTLNPDGTPKNAPVYGASYTDFNHPDLLKDGKWVFPSSASVNKMSNKPVGQAGWLTTKLLGKNQYPGTHAWGYAQQEYQAIDGNTYVRLISSGETPQPVNFRKWVKKLREADNEVGKDAINWKDVFPIGEFKYLSKNVDPNKLYPGTTWTRRTGCFLWAGADVGKYSIGKIFGSAEETLTVGQMPSHRHSVGWNNENGGYLPANNSWANAVNVRSQANYSFSDRHPNGHNNTGLLDYTGGNQPHNNMPPARSVYLWERTA